MWIQSRRSQGTRISQVPVIFVGQLSNELFRGARKAIPAGLAAEGVAVAEECGGLFWGQGRFLTAKGTNLLHEARSADLSLFFRHNRIPS